jgi:hypothetical protein
MIYDRSSVAMMTINIDAIERCFAAPISQQWTVAGDAGNKRGPGPRRRHAE